MLPHFLLLTLKSQDVADKKLFMLLALELVLFYFFVTGRQAKMAFGKLMF
jgi:hypothetical protein